MIEPKFKIGQNVTIFYVGAKPEDSFVRQVTGSTFYKRGEHIKYMGDYHRARNDLFMYEVSGMTGHHFPEFSLKEVAA
jgi:hypothetical protein